MTIRPLSGPEWTYHSNNGTVDGRESFDQPAAPSDNYEIRALPPLFVGAESDKIAVAARGNC